MSDHIHLAVVTYGRPIRRAFRKTFYVHCWECSYTQRFNDRYAAEIHKSELDDLAFPIGRGAV